MIDAAARGRMVLAAVSLVVLGAAVGIAADRLLHGRPRAVAVHAGRFDEALASLDSVLVLRPGQRDTVRAILDARQVTVDAVWRDTHYRLLDVVSGTVADLEAVLDGAQVERLRALVTELHGPLPLEGAARAPAH